jgi:AcrR family transcriptional regulator
MIDKPTTTRPPTRPTPRGAVRETAILAAVSELVGEVGYERMTIDAVAARAHASKTTIYRRWPGKAELVAEMLRVQDPGDAPLVSDSGSLSGDLTALLRRIGEGIAGRRGPSILHLTEALRSDDTLRGLVRDQIDRLTQRNAQAICAHAHSRGESLDLQRVSQALELAAGWLLLQILLNGCVPTAAARRQIVESVLIPVVEARLDPQSD